MKHIFFWAALLLVLGLTVMLALRWNELDAEQLAFEALADQVAEKRQEKEAMEADTGYTGTVLSEAGVKAGEVRENRESDWQGNEGGADHKERDILPEYQNLVLENPDFVGWIFIEGTDINYPVMQTPEEPEYYLHRDFNGQDSYAGTPFVGSGNLQEEGDLFIYGHNMKNGTMFADLLQYQQKVFWNAHPVIQLDNRYEHMKYQVISVFYAEETEWYGEGSLFNNTDLGGNMKRDEVIETFQKRGMHENSVMLDSRNPLLFLITCSYWKEDGRLVVVAVQEKL